jgi:hypothetical protein
MDMHEFFHITDIFESSYHLTLVLFSQDGSYSRGPIELLTADGGEHTYKIEQVLFQHFKRYSFEAMFLPGVIDRTSSLTV